MTTLTRAQAQYIATLRQQVADLTAQLAQAQADIARATRIIANLVPLDPITTDDIAWATARLKEER